MNDTGKALDYFYSTCSNAGADACGFWAESPETIHQNLDNLLEQVRAQPIPVPPRNGSVTSYGVIDYNALSNAVFYALWRPYNNWKPLATALGALAQGDGTAMFDYQQLGANREFSTVCQATGSVFTAGPEVLTAVTCNDGIEIPNTWEDTKAQYDRAMGLSQFGGFAAAVRVSCSGWPKLTTDNFKGRRCVVQYVMNIHSSSGPVGANTSYPILFIGNEAGK
jgi:hypothetical protein